MGFFSDDEKEDPKQEETAEEAADGSDGSNDSAFGFFKKSLDLGERVNDTTAQTKICLYRELTVFVSWLPVVDRQGWGWFG